MADIRIINAPRKVQPEIERLARITWDEHCDRQPYAFPKDSFSLTYKPALDRAFLAGDGAPMSESPYVFAAYKGDDFCGYIFLDEWSRPDLTDVPEVHIIDICVIPRFRGQGVAKALIDHVNFLARERDWDNLTATVWAENAASAKLFEDAGYVVQSTKYRFGPDRQARTYPTPDDAKKTAFRWDFAFMGAVLAVAAAIALWSR